MWPWWKVPLFRVAPHHNGDGGLAGHTIQYCFAIENEYNSKPTPQVYRSPRVIPELPLLSQLLSSFRR